MSCTVWRDTGSLMIDLRAHPQSMPERVAACLAASPLPCRAHLINAKAWLSMLVARDVRVVIADTGLPAPSLAATAHFGHRRFHAIAPTQAFTVTASCREWPSISSRGIRECKKCS